MFCDPPFQKRKLFPFLLRRQKTLLSEKQNILKELVAQWAWIVIFWRCKIKFLNWFASAVATLMLRNQHEIAIVHVWKGRIRKAQNETDDRKVEHFLYVNV